MSCEMTACFAKKLSLVDENGKSLSELMQIDDIEFYNNVFLFGRSMVLQEMVSKSAIRRRQGQ